MAVYTKITRPQLDDFLQHYDLPAVTGLHGIAQGVENTNYLLETAYDKYILTLFEKRTDPGDLPFFFAFTDHLCAHGISCPRIVRARDGGMLRSLAERPAALITFLNGKDIDKTQITPAHCQSLGRILAEMHQAALTFDGRRDNALSVEGWKELAARTASRADSVEPGLANIIKDEILFLERNWPAPDNLPRAAIHADLFPDNVFFDGDKVCGVIDFYFSCTDFLAYDLAIVMNAWCFDSRGNLLSARWEKLMDAYGSIRQLTAAERDMYPVLCRGAALRFLLTRLNDWIFHPEGAMVTPKDPLEYLAKLKWHQTQKQ